mmetsp:Transcript_896/g.1225  ORF Transcript_896/g.1225 Transcript_896/m.1225 type:complete len:89 (+) Transcript_896:31-297(+)|eukprot:CAMPEP_0170457964 /NCGR_PEP_ID=MMETSP0123-20130129/5076_1 /TAXON_ID=182087 /ORGANISM="Favella ehrenbergii, Strain Fehren 1" /LENGTH=88 /DNA_ID=CAMNT_0010721923 /DNA_START=15 /DNA_END=281 /DNA_ORIENTATION=-
MQTVKGEDGFFGPLRNLRSEEHVELKKANMAYTSCVSKSFMPRWLSGEALEINEVCGAQYEDMMEKHAGIYGEVPMPVQTLKLPEAQL